MNNINKESLKANISEISSNLPEEFENTLEKGSDETSTPVAGDDEISAIKAELKANPDVDESASSEDM